jgi:hypothetical protein
MLSQAQMWSCAYGVGRRPDAMDEVMISNVAFAILIII